MSERNSTLPQYRCAREGCGLGISAPVHYGIGSHAWVMPKEYEQFWISKKSGLIPLGGTDADKQA